MESIIEKLQTNKLTEVFFTARAPLNTTQVSKFCEAVIINKSLIEISFTAKSLSTLNGKQWIELLTALSKNSTLKVFNRINFLFIVNLFFFV